MSEAWTVLGWLALAVIAAGLALVLAIIARAVWVLFDVVSDLAASLQARIDREDDGR